MPVKRVFFALILGLCLAGCGFFNPPPTPTATPTVSRTPTSTPTIVWFPPSETPTPVIILTPTPTLERRPGIGSLILSDDFSDQTRWQTLQSDQGSIRYGKNELTIAIPGAKTLLFSLRRTPPLFDNFYLELTVTASLCPAGDAFGLLLRAASNTEFYRLLLSCTGELRLERLQGGQSTVLVNWTPNNQVPPGMALPFRLGVWVNGRDTRVFINDVYQIAVNDGAFFEGQVGVFARSEGKNPLTVSFSELSVRAIEFATATSAP